MEKALEIINSNKIGNNNGERKMEKFFKKNFEKGLDK